MKIKRNKKIKKLLNSKKSNKFGDQIKSCFACGVIITDKNTILCPNCKTNLININNKYKNIKKKMED